MNGILLKDALLKVTKALPDGAASTTSDPIDLGTTSNGDFTAQGEFLLSAPALDVTAAPNAKTVTYDIIHSDNSDLSSPVTLAPGVIVQLGGGGVGAAAATYRYKPPSTVKRYIGVKATGIATIAASGTTLTFEWLG